MMHFSTEPLSAQAAQHLRRLQDLVNAEQSQEVRFKLAQQLWENRKNKKADQRIWKEIEKNLADDHPRPGFCQYCEYDRFSPTEHFFPKKHFPERAFVWENFLRICHICNSECKGDKFAVFVPLGSASKQVSSDNTRKLSVPPSDDPVLINPRTDDPQRLMVLDLGSGIFLPILGADARTTTRVKYTSEVLQLNLNDNLVRYRKKQVENYGRKLGEYVGVKKANSYSELIDSLSSARKATVVVANDFELEKDRVLTLLKNDILDDPFPTTWLEIKRQKDCFPHLADLFEKAPEALDW